MGQPAGGQAGAQVDAEFELVHADTLRFFPELVAELGGDAGALRREAGLDGAAAGVGFRAVAELLELAATRLATPDFGLRLAALQGGAKAFGPMGVVMANSKTLGEALQYVTAHVHAYTLAARMRLVHERESGRVVVPLEILLDRLPHRQQAMEQAMLLGHLNAVESTGGVARVREVRFCHWALSPLRVYRERFGCEVRFDQEMDALVFSEQDLLAPVVDPDVQLYEMATCFIDAKFTRVAPPMHARVRGLILQHLGGASCTNERVAAELGLHPRTLHRRLKEEGTSFEAIKDEVRRDVALRCLQEGELPLTAIAEKLGYAETSVLSRSCFRWFAASPRQLRAQARAAGGGAQRGTG